MQGLLRLPPLPLPHLHKRRFKMYRRPMWVCYQDQEGEVMLEGLPLSPQDKDQGKDRVVCWWV